MAYDLHLADRVRAVVNGRRRVTEKAMFGGLAFLLDGKMFCGILGSELLVRVGPDAHDAAVARPHVRIMDFTGRPMRGYVFVGPAAIATAARLARWVDDGEAHVATLPQKAPRKTRGSGGRKPAGSVARPRRSRRADR